MSKVIIKAHPVTNELFTATSNPEWSKCRLESTRINVNNGVINSTKTVAFALIATKTAEALAYLQDGQEFPVPGKIIVNEYFDTDEKYQEGMVAKKYPASHPQAGQEVKVYGKSVYRDTVFTTNLEDQDSLKREVSF